MSIDQDLIDDFMYRTYGYAKPLAKSPVKYENALEKSTGMSRADAIKHFRGRGMDESEATEHVDAQIASAARDRAKAVEAGATDTRGMSGEEKRRVMREGVARQAGSPDVKPGSSHSIVPSVMPTYGTRSGSEGRNDQRLLPNNLERSWDKNQFSGDDGEGGEVGGARPFRVMPRKGRDSDTDLRDAKSSGNRRYEGGSRQPNNAQMMQRHERAERRRAKYDSDELERSWDKNQFSGGDDDGEVGGARPFRVMPRGTRDQDTDLRDAKSSGNRRYEGGSRQPNNAQMMQRHERAERRRAKYDSDED